MGGPASGKTGRIVLVVESPVRALALRRVVGPEVQVLATGGGGLGGRGGPRRGGGRVLQELIAAARNADRILLATDPDREGEAIAADLLRLLGPAFPGRVTRVHLADDSPAGVARALAEARPVDRGRLAARRLRDEVDRRFLAAAGRALGEGPPCGRVRAAALARVVARSERERSRWGVEVWLELPEGRCRAAAETTWALEAEATTVATALAGAALPAAAIVRRRFAESPPAPFDTAALLAESDALGLGPERVLEAARALHRGVELADGIEPLLSYPRTDEATLDPPEPGARPVAHGAIRPIAPEWPPERAAPFLAAAERKVYDRVWRRTAAARTGPACLEAIEVEVDAGGATVRLRAERVIDPGWRAVVEEESAEPAGAAARARVEGSEGGAGTEAGSARVGGATGDAVQEPRSVRVGGATGVAGREPGTARVGRARVVERAGVGPYRPGELVADLAAAGIGRPSTWATIARGLREVGWVRGEGGRLWATDEGRRAAGALREAFGTWLSPEHGAALEAGLRAVEEGRLEEAEFRRRFVAPLDEVGGGRKPGCPTCGRPLIGGACSGFPLCRASGRGPGRANP